MENYVLVDGSKIWTDIRGKNKLGYVLLCNGGPGCCDYLLPVSKMIEDNYIVIRFEQRGCGRSDSDRKYDLYTILKDMEGIRKYYNIENWIVGGHSWGANLALIYSLEFPQYTNCVLYIAGNGFQNNRDWSLEYHLNREKYGEKMPNMAYESNNEVNKMGNHTFREYIQQPKLYKKLINLSIRVLFMIAENDVRPDWPVTQLYNLIPNAKINYIKNSSHYIWLDQHDTMRKELKLFLKSLK